MARLKHGGVKAYSGDLERKIAALLEELQAWGLFLVPVGELEEWLAGRDVGVRKSDKRSWSNAAGHYIYRSGRQSGDVWDFTASVVRFLEGGLRTLQSGGDAVA